MGYYCAVAQAGYRVDCADATEIINCVVHGRVNGDQLITKEGITTYQKALLSGACQQTAMQIQSVIVEIQKNLTDTFSVIDSWFDREEDLRRYKPQDGGWSVDQILEHIALTNHFLLILIDKGARKALENAARMDLATEINKYTFHRDRLDEVGIHKSFDWIRPAHMEPTGAKTSKEVRAEVRDQVSRCLAHLDRLKNGEGALYKTRMSVNDLGKIDVYEYIYFLSRHGQRHITQMQHVEAGYKALVR